MTSTVALLLSTFILATPPTTQTGSETPVVKPMTEPMTQPEVLSPSKTRSAQAFSIVGELLGNTQVGVSLGSGGGGVFAVELPNVPLRLRWIDDSQLVVAYPEELTPSKRENRIQSFQEVVTIKYETYKGEGERIAALEKAFGWSTLAERRKQLPPKESTAIVVNGRTLRGRIVHVSEKNFRYDYYDVHEPDSSYQQLAAMGYQGGGPSWAGIVFGLIKLKQPRLMSKLRFDEEGEGLAVWSDDRKALQLVAELVTQAKSDKDLLKQAIAKAVAEGEME